MHHIPDASVALAFTSPPYNSGKEYDQDLDLTRYFSLIARVRADVYRVLKPSGRYVFNIANLGRRPYIPMYDYFYLVHIGLGFLPAGEVIWRKGKCPAPGGTGSLPGLPACRDSWPKRQAESKSASHALAKRKRKRSFRGVGRLPSGVPECAPWRAGK